MSAARFHFDPTHDPARVPSPQELRGWVEERIATPGTSLHLGAAATMASLGRQSTRRLVLFGMIPALRRHRERKHRRMCVEAATDAVCATRDVMREFAVDLTAHPSLSTTLDAIGALGVMAITERETRRFVENARARWEGLEDEIDDLDAKLDIIDTEMRMAGYAAGIRAELEAEAIGHLVLEEDDALDPDMRLAALRLAVGEVRQVDLKRAITTLLRRLGA